MKKILCIGNVSYDITVPLDNYPTENIKYRVDEKIGCGGGPASNAAYLLGKWGMNVSFAGVIGKDDLGKKIIDEFKTVSVNIKNVDIDKTHDTTISFIIVNKSNGSRTVFSNKKDMKLSKKVKMKADVILVDGQEFEASVDIIKRNPNAITVIDAGSVRGEVVELSKLVDYVVCSKNFAEDYTKIKIDVEDKTKINEIYEKMEQDFKNVIITLEEKGCLYKKDNIIKRMPSIDVEAIDSTGAGDFFHGAFVYCLAKGLDIEKTVMISNITGALSVTKVGSRFSAPDIEQVFQVYNKRV